MSELSSASFLMAVMTTLSSCVEKNDCDGGSVPWWRVVVVGHQRIVHFVALADGQRFAPRARVRIERVGEFVMSLVGVGIGPLGPAQQREAQDVVLGVVAVLGVVEQAEAVGCVREVGPAQRRNFELRLSRQECCAWSDARRCRRESRRSPCRCARSAGRRPSAGCASRASRPAC